MVANVVMKDPVENVRPLAAISEPRRYRRDREVDRALTASL